MSFFNTKAAAQSPGATDNRFQQWELAEKEWRNLAQQGQRDMTLWEAPVKKLQGLIDSVERPADRDRVWILAHESLADITREASWARAAIPNIQAENYYLRALNGLENSTDLDWARERYLSLVKKLTIEAQPNRGRYFLYYDQRPDFNGSVEMLENAVRLAESDEELSWTRYALAATLGSRGLSQPWNHRRAQMAFEAAIEEKDPQKNDWLDEALYQYGSWLEQYGELIIKEDGSWWAVADFETALKVYQRYLDTFEKGDAAFYDAVKNKIDQWIRDEVSVNVGSVFLPGSELEFGLNWRNLKRIELKLFPVSLNRNVDLSPEDSRAYQWISKIDLKGIQPIKTWEFLPKAEQSKRYQYFGDQLKIEDGSQLKPGAYILQATGSGVSDSALLIVSNAAALVKSVGDLAQVYVGASSSGAPVAKSQITLWESHRESVPRVGRRGTRSVQRWIRHEAVTDTDGMAKVQLNHPLEYRDYLVTVETDQGPAFCLGSSPRAMDSNTAGNSHSPQNWKIYALTDRPVYRPNDTIQWKYIARQLVEETYATPQGAVIQMEVLNPRGETIFDKESTLNAFGSAWGEFELGSDAPLGMYNARFFYKDPKESEKKYNIGYAQIFRLEEYKAPEFQVTVKTPVDDNGMAKAFRVGESVEATIEARYYSGAPVNEADVEVIVRKNPFYSSWPEPREFPWYYDSNPSGSGMSFGRGMALPRGHSGGGEEVMREMLKSDAAGRVTVTIPTELTSDQDWEYTIEARVTDASRREVVGEGKIRATRSLYEVHLRAERRTLEPGQKASVKIQAKDANNQPQQVDGKVYLNRLVWEEIWIAPDGREVGGSELIGLKERYVVFPPKPERPDQKAWQILQRGYRTENLTTQTLSTDSDGTALFEFTPTETGYFEIVYVSLDRDGIPVRGNTHIWTAKPGSGNIGYVSNDLEIIVDPDAFRVGQTAPILISAPNSGCFVWFTIESETLMESRLIRMKGSTQLIQLPMEDRHVPNFYIHVATIRDQRVYSDLEEMIVPPTKQFLTVEVELDQNAYAPGAEAEAKIRTLDDQGKPVSAELALTTLDASVLAIQGELQEDIRKFFYGQKRNRGVDTDNSFNDLSYRKISLEELQNTSGVAPGNDTSVFSVSLDQSRTQRGAQVLSKGASDSRFFFGRSAGLGEPQAMPAPRAMMAEGMAVADEAVGAGLALGFDVNSGGVATGGEAVKIRSDFRNTAVWIPDAVTDENGTATVNWEFPENLTEWKTKAWAVSGNAKVGWGESTVVTRQPLMLRLQAPRFAVVGDKLRVSAVVQNQSESDLKVQAALFGVVNEEQNIQGPDNGVRSIPAGGEVRIDWDLTILTAGELKLSGVVKTIGSGTALSDGMELTIPVYPHGMEQWIGTSGAISSDLKEALITFEVPAQRRTADTRLKVTIQPSLAGTVLDAIPYLFDYPYGCIEQTLSRFVPAVTVRKILSEQGVDPTELDQLWFGGLESDSISKTQKREARPWSELDEVVREGLAATLDAQLGNGAWGWWKGSSANDYMTAYALWSLALARQSGIEVPEGALKRAADYLEKQLVEWERQPDMSAWLLHAWTEARIALGLNLEVTNRVNRAAGLLSEQKDRLNPYTRALAMIALHNLDQKDAVTELLANLEMGSFKSDGSGASRISSSANGRVTNSAQAESIHWGSTLRYYNWSKGAVESTAFTLKALLKVQPDHPYVESSMRWLSLNRRGAHWNNTKDTAIAALALSDYLRVKGGLGNDSAFEIYWNGERLESHQFRAGEKAGLAQPFHLTLEGEQIRDGQNRLEIRRTNDGAPIYFGSWVEYFTLEEPIPSAGVGVFAERRNGRIRQVPTLLKGLKPVKSFFQSGGSAASGERMEVVLWIEAKQELEYVMVEDWKAAGMESTVLQSGSGVRARKLSEASIQAYRKSEDLFFERPLQTPYTGESVGAYQEIRDNRTAFFLDRLPEGIWEIRYEMRLETPGVYHTLPTRVEAMYLPEIRGNGQESLIEIEERP